MIYRLLLALALLLAPSVVQADLPLMNFGEGNGNGGVTPPPPTCTGAADFSDGCAVAIFGH